VKKQKCPGTRKSDRKRHLKIKRKRRKKGWIRMALKKK